MRYTVVIPTLNERGNIGRLTSQLLEDPRCSVVVCDNGSTDGTQSEAEKAGATLVQRESGSVSDAIETGIAHTVDSSVIVMDADGSHPAELVPALAQRLIYHDMVYGYREKSEDGLVNKFISTFGKTISYGLGPGIKDRMTGFFGLKQSLVTDVKINSGPKPFLEYLIRIAPVSIQGLPYNFKKREVGESKLGRSNSLVAGIVQLLKLSFMKYTRLIKYTTVGGVGTLIYLGSTIGAHELTTIPYYIGAIFGGCIAFVWNFTMHKVWTYAEDKDLSWRNLPSAVWNLGHTSDDPDFDWWEWTTGLPYKRSKRLLGQSIYELAKGDRFRSNGGSVLSLDCGSSPMLNMFDCPKGNNRLTLSKVGVDSSSAKIEFFKDHVDLDNTKLLSANVETLTHSYLAGYTDIQEFDLILCNKTLESSRTLDFLKDTLKVGGSIIISSPREDLIQMIESVGLTYVESRKDKVHLFKKDQGLEKVFTYA